MDITFDQKALSLLKRTLEIIRKEGMISLFYKVKERLRGRKPLEELDQIKTYFAGKHGLEIGGPSAIFADRSQLPIYDVVHSCDNCNFSTSAYLGK